MCGRKICLLTALQKTDVSAAVNALGKEDGIDVVKVFDNGLFRGCTIKAPKSTVDSIQDKAVVAKAWQSRRLTLGEPLVQRLGGEPQLSNYSVHDMTGVDKLHKANIKGKGAIVGVIDSGINYRHKAVSDTTERSPPVKHLLTGRLSSAEASAKASKSSVAMISQARRHGRRQARSRFQTRTPMTRTAMALMSRVSLQDRASSSQV